MNFEGELPRGMYGAGKVISQEKGSVIVHKAEPNKVLFTTAHTRYPQTYVGIRTGNKPTDWLFMNLTPKTLEEFAGAGVGPEKEHYNVAEPSAVEKLYNEKNTFSEKIDGARMLLKLRKHYVDAASYRQSVTGYPIMHTARLQLPRDLNIPAKLLGSTLVAEAYGERIPEKTAMAPALQSSIVAKLQGLPTIQRGAIMHALKLPGPTGERIRKNFVPTFMPNLQRAAPMPPPPPQVKPDFSKIGAYRDSRSKKKLLALLGMSSEPLKAKTGLNASSMLTGSDAPRLEQGIKMGGVAPIAVEVAEQSPRLLNWLFKKKERPEDLSTIPAVKHPLPEVMAQHEANLSTAETPAAEGRSAPEIKMATAIGRVEPEITKNPLRVDDTQPKKPKPAIPDTRPLLQDKAAAVKPGIGLFSRFMKRTHQHIQRVCDNASKLVKRYPGKYAGLIGQSRKHDKSKFSKDEMVPYIWLTEFHRCKDKGAEFKYPDGMETRVNKATLHHIQNSCHHPEFHDPAKAEIKLGANRDSLAKASDATGMGKLDIAEMVCDWAAMSQEKGTSLWDWIKKSVNKRWKFTPSQVSMIEEIAEVFETAEKKAHDGSFGATAEIPDDMVEVNFGLDTKYITSKELRKAIADGKLKGQCTMKHVKAGQEAIPIQELGGILNASLAESIRKQRKQKVKMRLAIFNILSQGKKPIGPEVPYTERLKMIQEILGHLPAETFHVPESGTDPESKRRLFEAIQSGKNKRTREGVVVVPETGVPTKIKFMPESDVIVRGMVPAEPGKYQGVGVGGFEYSLPGADKVLGRVGTGLSDELRAAMLKNPEAYIGRTARIRSMGAYPSGAHRAPALLAMHEG